ncbi:SPX domain-containing protein [Suillus clintonianus]|uniref:SPX domain-containing protein n=1 Tax=Suillus clintonianus TaxID=1904413 RepID=UPI001B87743D|nr:SPX domain-containing protein [Suillus clintonianus]KAG2142483.1 SPX domain-containing protein [Suillus clintonianus]
MLIKFISKPENTKITVLATLNKLLPTQLTSTHSLGQSVLPQPDAPTEGTTVLSATGQQRDSRIRPSLSVMLHDLSPPFRLTGSSSQAPSQTTPLPPKTPHLPPVFPFFRDTGSLAPTALHTLLPLLPPLHAHFFELLDSELEKVDSFYAEREKEMRDRGKLLKEQLNELGLHRKKYYESNGNATTPSWAARAHQSLSAALLALTQCHGRHHADTSKTNHQPGIAASESGRGETGPSDTTRDEGISERIIMSPLPTSIIDGSIQVGSIKSNRSCPPTKANGNIPRGNSVSLNSPQEYQNAKKRLKKAVVEYYRGLEALNNYRILNLTGFRKAVKKYEKITQVPVQAAYMKERVEPSAFASGAMVSSMLKEMEELFAARFGMSLKGLIFYLSICYTLSQNVVTRRKRSIIFVLARPRNPIISARFAQACGLVYLYLRQLPVY